MLTIGFVDAKAGLQKAIKAAGGPSKLAKLLRIKPQAVSQWDEIPLKRVVDVERVTGVRREELRPDFYGRAQSRLHEARA